MAVCSISPASSTTRRTRHCCSEMPLCCNISRIGTMIRSRVRKSAIGSERDVGPNWEEPFVGLDSGLSMISLTLRGWAWPTLQQNG